MKRLRVAHLLPNMDVGGRERIVADLCRTAAAQGIEPVVVTYDPPSGGAALDPDGASVVALDRRAPGFSRKLADLLAAERIDLLHAQGHIPAALARGAPVPTVATVHVGLSGNRRWLLPIVRGLRAAAAVTAVSDDLARTFGRLSGRRVATIPTGVDTELFRPVPRPREGPFTIGVVARLHKVKRHRDALAALRIIKARGIACRLVIAGDGAEAQGIVRLAAGLDVDLPGAVADVPALLSRLDAFLLCSDHEGTPAALLEAMAAGLPCVATRVGGIADAAGDAAFLVPRRSPAAIAEALARLIAHPEEAERLGRAARERALGCSLDRQAAAYAALYRLVLTS